MILMWDSKYDVREHIVKVPNDKLAKLEKMKKKIHTIFELCIWVGRFLPVHEAKLLREAMDE